MSGAVGYRRELGGQRQPGTTVLGPASLIGGITGGVLLLTLPSSVFDDVVPVLILIAVRAGDRAAPAQPLGRRAAQPRSVEHGGFELWIGIFLTGDLRRLLRCRAGRDPARAARHLHRRRPAAPQRREERARARSPTVWPRSSSCSSPTWRGTVVVLIAVGSVVGAQLGAHVGRRLPAPAAAGRHRGGRPGGRDQAPRVVRDRPADRDDGRPTTQRDARRAARPSRRSARTASRPSSSCTVAVTTAVSNSSVVSCTRAVGVDHRADARDRRLQHRPRPSRPRASG